MLGEVGGREPTGEAGGTEQDDVEFAGLSGCTGHAAIVAGRNQRAAGGVQDVDPDHPQEQPMPRRPLTHPVALAVTSAALGGALVAALVVGVAAGGAQEEPTPDG